jgi:hypothetical protein
MCGTWSWRTYEMHSVVLLKPGVTFFLTGSFLAVPRGSIPDRQNTAGCKKIRNSQSVHQNPYKFWQWLGNLVAYNFGIQLHLWLLHLRLHWLYFWPLRLHPRLLQLHLQLSRLHLDYIYYISDCFNFISDYYDYISDCHGYIIDYFDYIFDYSNYISDYYDYISDCFLSHPVFKDKTECITICMPGSSSIHIVSLSVKNQQQYHEKWIKRL